MKVDIIISGTTNAYELVKIFNPYNAWLPRTHMLECCPKSLLLKIILFYQLATPIIENAPTLPEFIDFYDGEVLLSTMEL